MIPEILRHVGGFVLERLLDRRLRADALGPGTQVEGKKLWRLQYSAWFRFIWLAQAAVWATAIGLGVWLWAQGQLDWRLEPALVLFVGFLAFALLMMRDAYTQQITVSAWGLTERRRGTVRAVCAWSDVARIRFVWYLDSYLVVPQQGTPIRLSMHIGGLQRFKALALRYAPPAALAGVAARISDLTRR